MPDHNLPHKYNVGEKLFFHDFNSHKLTDCQVVRAFYGGLPSNLYEIEYHAGGFYKNAPIIEKRAVYETELYFEIGDMSHNH